MRRLPVALVLGCAALVCPAAARAEPISTLASTAPAVTVQLPGAAANPFQAVSAAILDPLWDDFDVDVHAQPRAAHVTAGDGRHAEVSADWDSGLARCAAFADLGVATLHITERIDLRDLLGRHHVKADTKVHVKAGPHGKPGEHLKVETPGAASTPEPASLLLLGTAVAGVFWFGRQLL